MSDYQTNRLSDHMWDHQFTWTILWDKTPFQTIWQFFIVSFILKKGGSCPRVHVPQLHNGVSLHYVVWVKTMRDYYNSFTVLSLASQIPIYIVYKFCQLVKWRSQLYNVHFKETRKQEVRYQFKNETNRVCSEFYQTHS